MCVEFLLYACELNWYHLFSFIRRRDVIIHFAAKDQFLDMASMVILRAFTKETIRSKVDYEQFEELQDIDYTGDRTGAMQY